MLARRLNTASGAGSWIFGELHSSAAPGQAARWSSASDGRASALRLVFTSALLLGEKVRSDLKRSDTGGSTQLPNSVAGRSLSARSLCASELRGMPARALG